MLSFSYGLKRILNITLYCQRTLSTTSFAHFYRASNEPVYTYAYDSSERKKLELVLSKMRSKAPYTVPICIGNDQFNSDCLYTHPYPFDNKNPFVNITMANKDHLAMAIASCLKARETWSRVPLRERAGIFLKAADLVSGKYRDYLNAATVLGQAKTIIQAEIDAAAELADFLRFNVQFAEAALEYTPLSTPDCVNRIIFRPTEGFWVALSPFNFTAIGGNLASAPALMGNSIIWKPSPSSAYSNYLTYQIFLEAGVPPGVINFVPCNGPFFGKNVLGNPHLAGINFTGSTSTYKTILKEIANNLDAYKTYPRTIGECGGKNYHFVHQSANLEEVAMSTIRSAFEYSGQKCSACSRLYVPRSLWPKLKDLMLAHLSEAKVGSPLERETFTSAVIDELAFKKIASYIDYAKASVDLKIIAGGVYDDSIGYYIQPTIIETKNPLDKIMQDDIFGPIIGVVEYDENEIDEIIDIVDKTSSYGLTGAVFAEDEDFVKFFIDRMIDSVGNMYINVKSTGSVVGNQPFGGARLSGTNDKAGGPFYLLRFVSILSVKTKVKADSS